MKEHCETKTFYQFPCLEYIFDKPVTLETYSEYICFMVRKIIDEKREDGTYCYWCETRLHNAYNLIHNNDLGCCDVSVANRYCHENHDHMTPPKSTTCWDFDDVWTYEGWLDKQKNGIK